MSSAGGPPETFEMFVEALRAWFLVSVFSPGQGCFVAVFDVTTERKLAEEAMKESEERYRRFFTHGPDGLVVLDPITKRPLEFNDQVCRQR
jgi:PAS domain-containing protein